jgi:hypothetical protein
LVSSISILTGPVFAGSGTTSADILNIPVYSRGSSFSGAGVAIARGTGALYYNPAGIGNGPTEVSVTHTELLQDLRLDNLSASWQLGNKTGIGLGVTYLGYGNIQGYSNSATPTGQISAYSMVTSVGVSHRISPSLSFGLTAKPIFERLDKNTANTVTFDFGLLANSGPFSLGIEYANFGGSLKFLEESVKLPTALRVGAAYSAPLTGYTFSLAATRRVGDQVELGGGVEYSYSQMLAFRLGYGSTLGANSSSLDGFAAGIGLKIDQVGLDYTYRPSDTQEGIHQITAAYFIGR